MIVVGGVIGAGIFLNPRIVAERTGSSEGVLIAWAIGGVLALIGALCYAELGARRPQAGGAYVYLREAYGPMIAFVYGWIMLVVNYSGREAAVSMTFATYFCSSFDLPASLIQPIAIGAIVLLTGVSYFGIKAGAILQNALTMLKLLAVVALVVTGVFIAAPHAPAAAPPPVVISPWNFGAILMPVLFAYGGWAYINNIAGEIREPQRNLPLALVLGMAAVTLVYVTMNLVYVYAMPVGDMMATPRIGEAAAARLFGDWGARAMSLAVLVSVFGCISATVISGPRVFYAMARDGLFFRRLAEIHPRFRTPAHAIVFQGVWSAALCLSGTYTRLYTFVVFAAVLFYALAGASVIVLRRKHPEWERPYRTWGYPWTPLLYVGVCVVVLGSTIVSQPKESGVGLAILALGLPAYAFWRRRA